MILDSRLKIKGYEENILNNYFIIDYVCPKCNAKHSLIRHGAYCRCVCYIIDGAVSCDRLTITRLKCKSCTSTHAVLPGEVVPYRVFSLACIIQLVSEHFVCGKSVLDIASEFGLSHQLIYSFVKLFISFVASVFSVLRALNLLLLYKYSSILSCINNCSNIAFYYFSETKWPLFMSKFQIVLPRPVFVGVYFRPPT